MKERNISIDFLKFFAVLLITNSHMENLYGDYSFLATGGTIGDALFFFCSGFTIFSRPMNGILEFPNWYKKRINRIYPTIIATALIGSVFFNTQTDILEIILAKKYWFVPCIMIYYVAIFFIGSYFKDNFLPIFISVIALTAVWFYFLSQTPGFLIYGGHIIRWLLFFDFMLLGAKMGTMTDKIKSKPILDTIMLFLCIITFYILLILGMRANYFVVFQFFSIIPLMGVVYYFYKVGASKAIEKIYRNKSGNFIIRFISSLCLEVYLVQNFIFTDKLNHIFPLNILIILLIIFIAAYLTRCLSRFISQTFKDTPYEYKKIIELY